MGGVNTPLRIRILNQSDNQTVQDVLDGDRFDRKGATTCIGCINSDHGDLFCTPHAHKRAQNLDTRHPRLYLESSETQELAQIPSLIVFNYKNIPVNVQDQFESFLYLHTAVIVHIQDTRSSSICQM